MFTIFFVSAVIVYTQAVDSEKSRGAEKTCEKKRDFRNKKKLVFFWYCQTIVVVCSGGNDHKFEFYAEDLVNEKRQDALDGQKDYFWPCGPFQVHSHAAFEAI